MPSWDTVKIREGSLTALPSSPGRSRWRGCGSSAGPPSCYPLKLNRYIHDLKCSPQQHAFREVATIALKINNITRNHIRLKLSMLLTLNIEKANLPSTRSCKVGSSSTLRPRVLLAAFVRLRFTFCNCKNIFYKKAASAVPQSQYNYQYRDVFYGK